MKRKLTNRQINFLKAVVNHSEATYRVSDPAFMAPIQYKELKELLRHVKAITLEKATPK